VDVLQPPQHLVQEELVVLRRQVIIRLDDLARYTDKETLTREHMRAQ
jgi:hypothetical protein